MTQEIHRSLPQSVDAEKALLSCVAVSPRYGLGMCVERGVTVDSFHVPAHGIFYSTILELFESNKPVDFVHIGEWLKNRGKLEAVGGGAAITELFTHCPTTTNTKYYLDIVREKEQIRRLLIVSEGIATKCYDATASSEQLLDEAEKETLAIRSGYELKGSEISPKELTMEAIGAIQKLYENRGKINGLETGFSVFDKLTDGLHGSEMIVIAARPSMGKTALAMNIAEHIALRVGKAVGVFSLEMSAKQLMQRLICSVARVSLSNVRNGFLSERDFPALSAASLKLGSAGLHINDQSGLTIGALRAKARRMKDRHNIAALFVDYLQLMRGSSRRSQDNRQLEISEISAGLKDLSKELDIPVVVLAQLNRKPEDRSGGRPKMSDLKESGSIEQDADLIGLLHREEYYAEGEEEKDASKGKSTLIIAKQRNGPVDDVPLTFLNEFTRFEDRAFEPATQNEDPKRGKRK